MGFSSLDDSVEVGGFTIAARVERDDDGDAPWEREDGHGPVSEWRPKDSKRPWERILHEDRRSCRFYDMREAMVIAKRDGWDAPPYGPGTAGERAARAVEADFKRLHDWCNDEWYYVGVVLSVSKNGVVLDKHAASTWGVENDSDEYLVDVANELLDEAIEAGRGVLDKVCTCDDAVYVG